MTEQQKSKRDPRLDIWRGIAMLIIMVAHIPRNPWGSYIPARYGPSDAAEMFVFCSGFAAAIAFGGTYLRSGWWMGTRRILFRCWQIYWAHLCLFLSLAVIVVVLTWLSGPEGKNYVTALNLTRFFTETETALIGLVTFTWVPNYFDILPMYFGILLLVPVVMMLRQVQPVLPFVFCIGLYICVWVFDLQFPAEPWSDRRWFFNPLAWQLLFFTGFAISLGWIKTPDFDWRLIVLGLIFIIALIPLFRWQIYMNLEDPTLKEWNHWIRLKHWDQGGIFKTNEHPLRIIHVLVISYLAVCLVKGREHLLQKFPMTLVEKVGQQALPAFLWSMAFAWVCGFALDQLGRWTPENNMTIWVHLVNLGAIASVIVVAHIASFYKTQPWRRKPAPNLKSAPAAAASPQT